MVIFNTIQKMHKHLTNNENNLCKVFLIFTSLYFLFSLNVFSQGIGVNNTNPDASAILDLTATDRGLLVPRMTQTQRDAITSPATGLLIFQTDAPAGYYFYDGINWLKIITTAESKWDKIGNYVYNTTDSIGIGTSSPQQKLHVNGALQTKYLYPGLGNNVDYQYLIFGDPTVSWGGLMHNIGSANYGDGDDFTIYTYGGRDLVLQPGSPGELHIPFGNVGIGNTSPSTKLEVSGQIKITGGSPGANKVLTSDADGLATWETSPGAEEKQDSNISVTGWYRIAECTGGAKRANATFILTDKISGGGHSTVEFKMGISYSRTQYAHFILLSNSYYVYNTFTKVRLLTKGTYDPMYLEVYVTRSGNVYSNMSDNINTDGWNSVDWSAGSIPSGYTDTEYSLEGQFGVGRNSESMYVDTDGNVGIGTNAPTSELEVAGNILVKDNGSVKANGTGNLLLGNSSSYVKVGGDGSWSYIEGSSNHLSLQTSRDGDDVVFKGGDAITEYMRIESGTGNVGIGAPIPTEKLHIAGSLRLTETIKDVNNEGGTNGQILTSTGTALDWVDASVLNDGDWTANSPDIYNANSGGVSVGTNSNSITLTGDPWSPENVIAKLNVITPSSNTTMDVGIHNELSSNTSNSGLIAYGFYNKITTPSLKSAVGIYNKADSTSTSSRIGILNQALGKSTSSNTVQGINNVVLGTGTGTTYAILTENKSTGSGNNYNIYATDGINYMKDNLGLGLSIPSEKLDIDGIVRLRSVSAPSTTTERLYNSGGNLYWNGTQLNSTTSNSFTNGGNSFGATATLGTNDAYSLNIETNGTERMAINSAGKVGIGTSSPDELLDITGDGGALNAIIQGDGLTARQEVRLKLKRSGTQDEAGIEYHDDNGVNWFTGLGYWYGNTNDEYVIGTSGQLKDNNGFTGNAKLVIEQNGNVGIGTGNVVDEKLEVAGNILVNNNASILADGSGLLYVGTTSANVKFGGDGSWSFIEGNGNHLSLQTSRDGDDIVFKGGDNITEHMRILGDYGNVGIGTSPSTSALLTVAGKVKITGGSPGLGKILTSDANGLATWETPASGADDLGNHTATQELNMNGYDIEDATRIAFSTSSSSASSLTISAQDAAANGSFGTNGGNLILRAGEGANSFSTSGQDGKIKLLDGNTLIGEKLEYEYGTPSGQSVTITGKVEKLVRFSNSTKELYEDDYVIIQFSTTAFEIKAKTTAMAGKWGSSRIPWKDNEGSPNYVYTWTGGVFGGNNNGEVDVTTIGFNKITIADEFYNPGSNAANIWVFAKEDNASPVYRITSQALTGINNYNRYAIIEVYYD